MRSGALRFVPRFEARAVLEAAATPGWGIVSEDLVSSLVIVSVEMRSKDAHSL